jgi:FkbM family methyltransferase
MVARVKEFALPVAGVVLLAIIITVVFGTAPSPQTSPAVGGVQRDGPLTSRGYTDAPRELSANTADLDNVRIVPMAAWDKSDRLTLQDFSWRQSSFNSVMAARVNGILRFHNIEVEAVAVDDWLEARHCAGIELDAESAEQRVQHGLRRTIEQHHLILSVEIVDDILPGVLSSAELIRSIVEQGYDAFEYRDGTFINHRLTDHYRYDKT